MKGIYKITSPTGRIYIGQTINLKLREKSYKNIAGKKNPPDTAINRSIFKYGWGAHKFEIVYALPEDVSKEVLTQYEQFYMDQFREAGYTLLNMCPAAGSPTGFSLSQETKKKLSDINFGKTLSEETKRKISQTLRGMKKTPEHIANATFGRREYRATEETKKKIAEHKLATNPASAKWREKLRAAWVIRKQRNHA